MCLEFAGIQENGQFRNDEPSVEEIDIRQSLYHLGDCVEEQDDALCNYNCNQEYTSFGECSKVEYESDAKCKCFGFSSWVLSTSDELAQRSSTFTGSCRDISTGNDCEKACKYEEFPFGRCNNLEECVCYAYKSRPCWIAWNFIALIVQNHTSCYVYRYTSIYIYMYACIW